MIPHHLDARAMAHPEPLEKAVAILRRLDEASYLYMLGRKNPIPLLKLAEEHHFRVLSREVHPDEWHILITPNQHADLEGAIRV